MAEVFIISLKRKEGERSEALAASLSQKVMGGKRIDPASRRPSTHLASTLALATVFAFAAHIARIAAALALATIHALAVMLGRRDAR
jgi:hypothetical protein